MSDIKVGRLTSAGLNRDAIHVAVIPVTAGERLEPGQKVTIRNGEASGVAYDSIYWVGVVDPFLTNYVSSGDTFWLFLNPGRIANLRHDWDHPAFPKTPDYPDNFDEYDGCRGC